MAPPLAPAMLIRAAGRIGFASAVTAVVLLVVVLLAFLRVPEPPHVEPTPPGAPALTKHVLFVMVDGLRYDYASDAEKMPHFAARMRTETNAVSWAGRMTMTSAAVLTIGTGLRGDFAQVITNVDAGRSTSNDIFQNAHAAGLRTALVGDDTWVKVYGSEAFDEQATHTHELSLGIDNSDEMLAAAKKILLNEPRPNLAVVHLVAPDHVGHAIGAANPAYFALLRKFDAGLDALLRELPPDVTVVATSDHGMKVTGAHGADSDVERRCPFFAYGPGIAHVMLPRIEQIDLSSTLAALLGIAAPSAGRGTPIVEVLATDETTRATIACTDAKRAARLAASMDVRRGMGVPAACLAGGRPEGAIAAARQQVRELDRALDHAQASAGRAGWAGAIAVLVILVLLAGYVLALAAEARIELAHVVPPFVVAGLIVALDAYVERITPPWHNVVRGSVYAIASAIALAGVVFPKRAASVYRHAPALALAFFPAALAWTFPTRAQAMTWATLLVAPLAWWIAAARDGTFAAKRRSLVLAIVLAPAVVAALPLARYVDNPIPDWLAESGPRMHAAALGSVATWLVVGGAIRERLRGVGSALLGLALAGASLELVHRVPSHVALPALFVSAGVALLAARRGLPTLAMGALFAAYGWVSRDFEVPFVVALAIVAEVVARWIPDAIATDGVDPERAPWALATTSGLLFAITFLVRVSVQSGLDFPTIDWAAGTFADAHASLARVGVLIGWKYVAAAILVVGIFVVRAATAARVALLGALALLLASRAAVDAWVLFACRGSYFTAFHAFGDLPATLLLAATAGVAAVVLSRAARAVRADAARP